MNKLYTKNNFAIVFIFILSLILILLLISSLNINFKNNYITIKNVDILFDVRDNRKVDLSLKKIPSILNKEKDDIPCPADVQCFDNYSDLKHPFDTLFDHLLSKKNAVRIAWYGDSFTEADILLGYFRDTMQSIFGGRGVGIVPIVAASHSYRNTVKHFFASWRCYNAVYNKTCEDLGISTTVAIPYVGSYVIYKSTDTVNYGNYKNTNAFSQAIVYYLGNDDTKFDFQINDNETENAILTKKDSVADFLIKSDEDISTLKLSFPEKTDTKFFGVSLQDSLGLYIDNFSMKSNNGITMLNLNDNYLEQSQKILKYDLIVLQFGLNVMCSETRDYSFFEKSFGELIKKFQKLFPDIPILIISIPDRSTMLSGEYITMPTVYYLLEAQENIARNNKVIFWNLFEAMGGKNSMAKWVEEGNANKDYTHLNFRGGKKLSMKLFDSFNHEFNNYKKRNLYDNK